MKSLLRSWVIPAILLVAATAVAQVSTGTTPLGSFSSGPDIINLGNLNVHFAAPVISKPGRGTQFDYILSFDSSIWTPITISGVKNWQPTTNWGWRAITEASTGYISRQRVTVQCLIDDGTEYVPPRPPRYLNEPQWLNYQYHDAFGVTHAGFSNITGGCVGDIDPSNSTSTDSTGMTLDTSTVPAKVTTASGTVIAAPLDVGTGAATKTDRNGNQLTTTSGSSFTDTLGMTVLSVSGGAPSPLVLTYTTSSNTPASVTVNYSPYTVQTAFGCSGVSEYGPTAAYLASSMSLPDGSSYTFQYEATPGVPANVTGRVRSITLRTGGTISYLYTGGSNGIECVDGSTAGLTRTTADGTNTYSRSGSGTAWTTTSTDASSPGNQTVINFQAAGSPPNFYETHRTVNQGASTTLVQTDTCYNAAVEPNCSSTAIALPLTEVKRYTILPNASQSLNDALINGVGLPSEVDEYDFGTSPHGALVRKTLVTYASLGNGIGALPGSITIQDGSGTQRSKATFGYDETAVTSTSGVPQHAAITGSRGNQTTLTQWVSATASSLNTLLAYDDTGNILSQTDPAGNVTQYSYADSFSDGVNRTSLAYLTQTSQPSTGSPTVAHITKSQFDANTGMQAAAWDMNNNETTYSYDALNRPLQVNVPDGGQTSYVYNSATSTTHNRKISSSQTLSTTNLLDSMGRSLQQQLTSDPAGTTSSDATYNSNGLLTSVSNPHRSVSNPTDGITSAIYDALGRTTVLTRPDSNTVTASFSNNCVTVTDEATKQRKMCIDGLGRITATFEPDSTNALNWETDTTYDVFNNPVNVTQKGGSSVSAQWRVRSFAYDGLSRLTQASAPESGTTNYYYLTASGAMCSGNTSKQCRVTDARSITKTFTYDAIGRLTGKTYSDTTPIVSYFYDQTSFNGLTITNGNGVRTGMTDGSGSTAWSFDTVGRVLKRQQTISGVTKSIGYTYNLAGSVATLTYPSGRVYTYSYNNAGQTTSLVDSVHSLNFFTGGTYAPPGILTGGVYGAVTGWNAITLANTFNNRLQPTQLKATSPVPLTLLNLSYSYDQGSGKNNGNIVQITNGRDSTRTVSYTYDQVNRLSTAQTASSWGDSYVYDPWGNLLQKNVNLGTAENMLLTMNSKNQVETPGFTYDGAGNATWDTGNALKFDAESRMTPVSGATYTYDGDDRRVQRSDGTLLWVDDSHEPLSVGTTSGITQDYVFLNGKRIAFVPISSGHAYYYLSDHLGSDTVVAGGDGKSIQWEADYFPFGAQRAVLTNLVSNPYQFTGYEYDSGSGYNYAVARYEAGRWGRFQSPDPYLGSADITNPQSLNRYSYVLNQVTRFFDPLGLDGVPFTCTDGVCVQDAPLPQSADVPGSMDPTGGGGDGGASRHHPPLQDGSDPGGHGGGGPRNPSEPQKPAEPKPGWCTAAMHAGNTTMGVAAVVGLWGVFADAGIVTAPAGVALGTVALIGGFVGALGVAVGDAGLGLGICQ
jgi:RHS repeat-associated protein